MPGDVLMDAAAAVGVAATEFVEGLSGVGRFRAMDVPVAAVPAGKPVSPARAAGPGPTPPAAASRPVTAVTGVEAGERGPLARGARQMLGVLAMFHPRPLTRTQLSMLTGVKQGKTMTTYLSAMRTRGLVSTDDREVALTDDGLAAVDGGVPEGLGQGEVLELWRRNLPGGARRMFDALVDAYPGVLSRDELAVVAGSDQPKTLTTYLSKLRANGLVTVDGQMVRASDDLMMVGGLI